MQTTAQRKQKYPTVGAFLANIFKRKDKLNMLNELYYKEYCYPLHDMAVEAVNNWITKHEGRFSDAEKAAYAVLVQFDTVAYRWNEQFGDHIAATSKGKEPLSTDQFKAIALNLDFARDIMADNLHYTDIVCEKIEEKNWQYRVQGELMTQLGALFLERLALWTHVTTNIGLHGKEGPWSRYTNEFSNVITPDTTGVPNLKACGWIGDDKEVESFFTNLLNHVKALNKLAEIHTK